jgi:hypothetical protein
MKKTLLTGRLAARLAEGAVQADLARTYGAVQADLSEATISRLANPSPFEHGAVGL